VITTEAQQNVGVVLHHRW